MPKLQDPDFSETSVSSDQGSESFVNLDSDVMDNKPAPGVEEEDNEARKNKKDTGAGFHMLSGQESLSTSPMNPLQIWLLGNIAFGSSSGDTALKQQDRAGPTALIGIGTAVILKKDSSVCVRSMEPSQNRRGEARSLINR